MKFSHKKKAYVSAILYSIIIGFSFLFSKISLTFADPLDTLAYRFTVSFIFAFVSVLLGWIKLDITKKIFFLFCLYHYFIQLCSLAFRFLD